MNPTQFIMIAPFFLVCHCVKTKRNYKRDRFSAAHLMEHRHQRKRWFFCERACYTFHNLVLESLSLSALHCNIVHVNVLVYMPLNTTQHNTIVQTFSGEPWHTRWSRSQQWIRSQYTETLHFSSLFDTLARFSWPNRLSIIITMPIHCTWTHSHWFCNHILFAHFKKRKIQ